MAFWAENINLSPAYILFRKTKRQWGSCSAKNVLSFNTMIMKLPPDVIEYIIVHELSHIKHRHHQKAFWQLIERYLPDYKRRVQELMTYTTSGVYHRFILSSCFYAYHSFGICICLHLLP